MSVIRQHPFKEGVMGVIEKHFGNTIAERFVLVFESDYFDKMEVEDIWRADKGDMVTLEVRYRLFDDTVKYVCDVYSWESKEKTESRLLRGITDKYVSGEIGDDWRENNGILEVSQEVLSGKHETKT